MFDIAWTELLVIIVIALVVVGPKDLPRMMRTVGQWAGRARAMADQFRRSFEDIARQSELDDLRAEVNRLQQTYVPPAEEIESAMYPTGSIPSSPTADIPVPSPAAEAPASVPAPEPPAADAPTTATARS
jgi:sec-independent protein translocase protein TatB